jgi:hypothetical protein
MSELYTLTFGATGIQFAPRTDPALEAVLQEDALPGYYVHASMGDENLLVCLAMRKDEGAGGIFVLEDTDSVLYVAVAESNLAYAEGLNHFAEIVAQTRYAVDIFDEVDEEDECEDATCQCHK